MKKTFLLLSAVLGLISSSQAQWQQLGIPVQPHMPFSVVGEKMFCGTNFSPDGGVTYQDRSSYLPQPDVRLIKIIGQTTYASFKQNFTNIGLLYESADYGLTWTLDTAYPGTYSCVGYLEEYNGALYAMAEGWEVLKSADGGNSWTDVTPYNTVGVLEPGFVGCGNITFGISSAGLAQSTDVLTWSLTFPSAPVATRPNIVDNNNSRLYAGGNQSLLYSDDCGDNWVDIYNKISAGFGVANLVHANGDEIATTGDGIWLCQQGDSTWAKMTTPAAMGVIYADRAVVDGDYLYCSDTSHIWRIKTSQINTGVVQATVFNGSIKISPNPANDRVQVDLKLNSPQAVSFAVIDVSGRIVETEPVKQLQAGKHTISVRTDGLAAGVYLLKISDGQTTVNEKIMIQH